MRGLPEEHVIASLSKLTGGRMCVDMEGYRCAGEPCPAAPAQRLRRTRQRHLRAEFWSFHAGDLTVEAVNAELDEYLRYYNDERPHTGIGMMTPNEYYATLSALSEKSEMS